MRRRSSRRATGWRRPGSAARAKARTTSASGCRGASGESGPPPVEVATGVQRGRLAVSDVESGALRAAQRTSSRSFTRSVRILAQWWGMVRTSSDDGRTWSAARRLPDGILGPIKNKPVRLPDGTIIAPSSTETPESPSTWRVHFERSRDAGATWSVSRPAGRGRGEPIDAIQPSILMHAGGQIAGGRPHARRAVSSRRGPRTAARRGRR